MFGVRHITIRRWMLAYGIEARPSHGLARRGVQEPTAEQLYDLVHIQHLSYREIGAMLDMNFTTVPLLLKRHGITRPSVWVTRRKGVTPKMPSVEELRHRRARGESATSIAKSCGVDKATIVQLCRNNGIEVDRDGWDGGKRHACLDGHEARSTYEQRVDDWLHMHGIRHEVEPRYPFDSRYKADFLVQRTFIEVWGVTSNAAYAARRADKIARCQANNVPLISINVWQFAKGRKWWKPLEVLLPKSTPSHLF